MTTAISLVVWPHGRKLLKKFLRHTNGLLYSFIFIMEAEKNGALPFTDVLVTRSVDDTTGYAV